MKWAMVWLVGVVMASVFLGACAAKPTVPEVKYVPVDNSDKILQGVRDLLSDQNAAEARRTEHLLPKDNTGVVVFMAVLAVLGMAGVSITSLVLMTRARKTRVYYPEWREVPQLEEDKISYWDPQLVSEKQGIHLLEMLDE